MKHYDGCADSDQSAAMTELNHWRTCDRRRSAWRAASGRRSSRFSSARGDGLEEETDGVSEAEKTASNKMDNRGRQKIFSNGQGDNLKDQRWVSLQVLVYLEWGRPFENAPEQRRRSTTRTRSSNCQASPPLSFVLIARNAYFRGIWQSWSKLYHPIWRRVSRSQSKEQNLAQQWTRRGQMKMNWWRDHFRFTWRCSLGTVGMTFPVQTSRKQHVWKVYTWTRSTMV